MDRRLREAERRFRAGDPEAEETLWRLQGTVPPRISAEHARSIERLWGMLSEPDTARDAMTYVVDMGRMVAQRYDNWVALQMESDVRHIGWSHVQRLASYIVRGRNNWARRSGHPWPLVRRSERDYRIKRAIARLKKMRGLPTGNTDHQVLAVDTAGNYGMGMEVSRPRRPRR